MLKGQERRWKICPIPRLTNRGPLRENQMDQQKTALKTVRKTAAEVSLQAMGKTAGQTGQSADGNQPADSKQSSQTSQNGQTNENGQIGGTRYFILPVGGKILKDYDDRNLQYSETYKDWRLHLALDIAANKGTAVFSAAKGTVEDIYEDSLLGTVVKINHGSGLTAYYCGLNSSPSVKKGEQIDGGYQIGAIAEIPCESVEENHLHLIMEQDGSPVSPLKVMEMKD